MNFEAFKVQVRYVKRIRTVAAMAYDLSGDVGQFLIENGADDSLENQWGLSPYDGISAKDAAF